ncbi:ArsR/SmtB family transcription factor [Amycolatopsis suaedae]|nr:metalloregulator ArsR/SmtB family transcription factor [Amycolatopsis suaedae]
MDGNGTEERLEALGRALNCRFRLVMLQVLAEGETCVSDLVRRSGTTQPNVSNHLAVLRAADLVTAERHGRLVRYRLASPEVADLVRSLTALVDRSGTGT